MSKLEKIKRGVSRAVKFVTFRVLFNGIYILHAKKPVQENKILFIEVRETSISNSFQLLYKKLKKDKKYTIHTHYLRSGFTGRLEYTRRCTAMLKDMADAKYIFINDSIPVLNTISLRNETKLIQVWHGCGAFKKFGYSTADLLFGDSKIELEKYPIHQNYSLVTVSSPEVVSAFAEAMGLEKQKEIIQPIGVSRSDIYFRSKFYKKAKEKLENLMPSAKNKKILLYAPTYRGSVAEAKTPDVLDITLFSKELGQEYVLLLKHHPLVKKLPIIDQEKRAFCMDMTSKMSIEELLCVSDICISDYSDNEPSFLKIFCLRQTINHCNNLSIRLPH